MEFPKVIAIHLSFNSTQKEKERGGGGKETSYYFSIGELDKSQGKRCLEDLYIIRRYSHQNCSEFHGLWAQEPMGPLTKTSNYLKCQLPFLKNSKFYHWRICQNLCCPLLQLIMRVTFGLSLGTLTKGGPGADFGKRPRPGTTLNERSCSWDRIRGALEEPHRETGRKERHHSQSGRCHVTQNSQWKFWERALFSMKNTQKIFDYFQKIYSL